MSIVELLAELRQRTQIIERRIADLRTAEETSPLDLYNAGSFRELSSEHAFLTDLINQVEEGIQSHA